MKANPVSIAADNLPRQPAQYHQRILPVEEIECRKYQSTHYRTSQNIQIPRANTHFDTSTDTGKSRSQDTMKSVGDDLKLISSSELSISSMEHTLYQDSLKEYVGKYIPLSIPFLSFWTMSVKCEVVLCELSSKLVFRRKLRLRLSFTLQILLRDMLLIYIWVIFWYYWKQQELHNSYLV